MGANSQQFENQVSRLDSQVTFYLRHRSRFTHPRPLYYHFILGRSARSLS